MSRTHAHTHTSSGPHLSVKQESETQVLAYTQMCVHFRTSICKYDSHMTWLCAYTKICVHLHIYTHIHIYILVYIITIEYASYVCTHTYTHIYLCTFTTIEYALYIYTHTYTHIYRLAEREHQRELAYIINSLLRKDDATAAPHLAVIVRAINMLLITGRNDSEMICFPPNGVTYRGGGLSDQYRRFYQVGKVFRYQSHLCVYLHG